MPPKTPPQAPPSSGIPGVRMSSSIPVEPPMILVVGPSKSGKSAASSSLLGWRGLDPLVIAFDPTGPDTCTDLGFPVPVVIPENEPSPPDDKDDSLFGKVRSTLAKLENYFKRGRTPPYNAIITDCASTMVDKLMNDDRRINPSKDQRRNYMNVLRQGTEIINRLTNLGVPTIWLAWLQEPFIETEDDKKAPGAKAPKRQVMGGPMVDGAKLRTLLSGKAHQILAMETFLGAPGAQGLCADGYVRRFHTKPWDFIAAGGRYSSKLPEPCPPDYAWILDQIMGSRS